MQRPVQGMPPVGIVFDCDLGTDAGAALALAVLYGLDGKNECRVAGTTISVANLKSAALSEVIARFYSGEVAAGFNAGGRTLPVGLATEGRRVDDTPMLTVPLAKKGPDGKPVYAHGIDRIIDTADPLDVFRNALSAQYPQNAVVVVAGPASNAAAALKYPALKNLIPEKARLLVIAAGSYPDGKPEAGIQADIAAARRLFAEWPTPIVAVGSEVGEAIPFPGTSIETDFAWSPAHPVADAYKAHQPMPYDAPAAPVAAALYAVRSKDPMFRLSEPGTITVLDDGRTKFTASPGGKHRYVIVDPAQKSELQRVYAELASAKPVTRAPRRRRPQQNQQQQQQPPAQAPKPAAEL